MFIKNKLTTIKPIVKKVKYSTFAKGINTEYDEYLTPITYSKNTYNFCFKDGNLKPGLGIEAFSLPRNYNPDCEKIEMIMPEGVDVLRMWKYVRNQAGGAKEEVVLIYCSDGYIYYTFLYVGMNYFAKLTNMNFTAIPNAINFRLNSRDVIIFTSKFDGMYVWDRVYSPQHIENAPYITSMCIHYERLFSTVFNYPLQLWFSEDLDPTNWNITLDEAGFIEMADERGELQKVISFNDYIYVFREYGITRVSANANQENFFVTQMFVSSNKLYTDTIVVCGDKVLMLGSDGVYVFNGISTQRIKFNIENLFVNVSNLKSFACYHNGKYYVACNLKFPDNDLVGCENGNYTNNTLLEVDLNDFSLNIVRGMDVISLTSLSDAYMTKLCLCVKNQNGTAVVGQLTEDGKFFGIPTRKSWQAPFSDFGYPDRFKIVKKITIKSNYNFKVTVKTETHEKTFNAISRKGMCTICPLMKGKMIALNFNTENEEVGISDPQVIIEVI